MVQSPELQVWQERNGCWQIYDPTTQAHHQLNSEDEARAWLDRRSHFRR
ncbi:hypothetical protein [Leptolyngbya sp. FACHB-261]|nr:hypothetical protein [Leptolyngbya sp. FACHB-261]MBD2103997.1 hypothetical protein [Leptolyngbya sp. FACHB-261]